MWCWRLVVPCALLLGVGAACSGGSSSDGDGSGGTGSATSPLGGSSGVGGTSGSHGGSASRGGTAGNGMGGTSARGGGAGDDGGGGGTEGGRNGTGNGGDAGGGVAGDDSGGMGGTSPCVPGSTYSDSFTANEQGNLDLLRGYERIEGDLDLTRGVTSLAPLECLRNVTGRLTIASNPGLSNLHGLEALEHVGKLELGHCYLHAPDSEADPPYDCLGNDGLVDVDALENLTELDLELIVGGNSKLVSLAGLGNLNAEVGVTIWLNPALTNLDGLEGLHGEVSSVVIVNNESLTNLDALENVTLVNDIFLEDNPLLADLSGLSHVSDAGRLELDASGLTDLDDLAALERVVEYVRIYRNPLLTDLHGLGALQEVGGFSIGNNSTLSECEAEWLCSVVPTAYCLTGSNAEDSDTCTPL